MHINYADICILKMLSNQPFFKTQELENYDMTDQHSSSRDPERSTEGSHIISLGNSLFPDHKNFAQ